MMYTGKQLRALVMPLMFEQFLNVMVGMVDTLMVSKAGEAAVSGVALTTNINLLIIQVMAALATGGAVVCSQYNGRRDTKDCRRVKLGLHIDIAKLQITEIRGFAIPRRFCNL